jgi:hypothetical protein
MTARVPMIPRTVTVFLLNSPPPNRVVTRLKTAAVCSGRVAKGSVIRAAEISAH